MFAYEHFGIEPDIMTLAKGLGGGFPIGAIIAKDEYASFEPGDHGTTFGGNPVACACASAVLSAIEKENLLEHVSSLGQYMENLLENLTEKYSIVIKTQGIGYLRGLKIAESINVNSIINKMIDKGFLLCPSGGNTLRIVPPLIMDKENIKKMISALDNVLNTLQENN